MKTNNNYYFLLVATFALMAVFAPNSTFAQCSELSNAGGVSGYETQCGPYNPTPILSSSLPSGGSGGTIEYAWMKNSSPVNQGATIISNTNSVSYDPPTIDKTTFYRRCARRCGTTVWGLAKESNWVEKRVKFCAPAPNCSGSNTWTWSQSIDPTNGSPSVVGLIYSGTTAHAITTGIPSAVNGPVTISVTDAVSYDGYPNRTNTANQTNERWRLKFYKGTSVVYTTPYTTDGIATGLEQDYWRGPLGGSVFLPNGFDKVFIQHIGGPGPGSVIPASFCVSYTPCSPLTNAGTISGNQTYCNSGNMSVSSSSVASGGSGGSIQYQWQWSHDGVTWTSSAATGASWNVGTRTVSHYFRRLAKRSTCGSWIPSNVVLHTVNKELTSAGTVSGDRTYCNSGNAPAFVSNSAGSGGSGGSVKYVWQYSTNNGTTWVNMSTQTGATYDPGTLTATRWYRRQARRTTNCGNWLYSNIVKVTIDKPLTSAGTITGDQAYCNAANPPAFGSASAGSGGSGGTIQYQWRLSTNNGASWSNIGGATSSTYNHVAVSSTTWFQRQARRTTACGSWLLSNIVKVTINGQLTSAGTIGSSQTFCNSGDPATLTNTSTPSGGSGGSIQYQWYYYVQGVGPWTAISGATSSTYNPSTITVSTQYRRGAKRSVCGSTIYTPYVTITINKELTSAGTITGNETFCNSANFGNITSSSVASGGSGGSVQYQWQYKTTGSWTSISGATGATYDPGVGNVTYQYRRLAKRSTCGSWIYSNVITKTVNKPLTSAGAIGSPQTYCNSYNIPNLTSMTAPSGGSGGTILYVWQKSTNNSTWSTISGATGATYDPGVISTTTYYRRGAKRSVCGNNIYSSSVKITINKELTNAGTITGNQTYCNSGNMSVSSTSVASGGSGGSIQYQWQWSLDGIIWTNDLSATGASWSVGTRTVTHYFRRLSKRSGCGSWKYSNVAVHTVEKPLTNAGTISGDRTYCNSGNAPAFVSNSAGSGGSGGSVKYEWQYSTNNGTTWVNMSTQTGATYDPGTLTATRWYRRQARRTTNCGNWLYSNIVKVTIDKPLTSAGTITGDQAYCNAANPPAFGSASAGSGGSGGTIQYQWRLSTNNGASWSNIGGATSSTYNHVAVSSTTWFQRQARRTTACGSWLLSNIVKVTINGQLTSAGTIGSSQTFCNSGDPATLTNTSTPSGGSGGSIQYQWYYYVQGVGPWTAISGATSSTYNPSTITVSTQYRRGAKRSVCGSTIYTPYVTITINKELTSAGTITGNETFCNSANFGNITSSSVASGGSGGSVQYQWQYKTTGSWTNISGATGATYDPGVGNVTYQYRRLAKRSSCGPWIYSNVITKTVNKELTSAGTISGDQTYCNTGDAPAFVSNSAGSGGSGGSVKYVWQYSTNNGTTWVNMSTQTSATYDPGTLTATRWYRRQARRTTNCGNWLYSNIVKVTINKELTSAGTISGDQAYCNSGNAPAFISNSAGSGGSGGSVKYVWQYSTNNGTTWVNMHTQTGATYDPGILTSSRWYRRQARRTTNCGNWLYSNIVKITINNGVDAGVDGNTAVCDHSTTSINLTSLITGEDAGGTWTRLTGTGGAFNASAGTYVPAVGATTSTFRYTVTGTAPCPNDMSVATVTINVCKVKLSGIVFNDESGPANVDGSPIGMAGTTQLYANLIKPDGTVEAVTPISSLGMYEFAAVDPNTAYKVVLTDAPGTVGNQEPAPSLPNGWVTVSEDCCDGVGNDGTHDGINYATTGTTDLPMVNFGIREPVSIGNSVWIDENQNGIKDAGETPLANAIVNIYEDNNNDGNPDGAAVSTMTTGADGLYAFNNLHAGKYIIGVVPPTIQDGAYESPTTGEETNPNLDVDNNDNGITKVGSEVRSGTINLVAGSEPTGEQPNNTSPVPDANANLTIDFGFYACPSSFQFDPVDLCLNTTFDLTSVEPTEFTGGVWTSNGQVASTPTAVGTGTYTYNYNNGSCSATGSLLIADNVPDYTPTIQIAPSAITGTSQVRVILGVSEILNKESCSDLYVLVPKMIPRFTFQFLPNATSVGGILVSNADWEYYENANPNFYIWKYVGGTGTFPANGSVKLGYIGSYDPSNTDGQSTFSIQVSQGSGGETNHANNTDSDLLIYFR